VQKLQLDTPVLDLIFPADKDLDSAKARGDALMAALGERAKDLMVLDVDLDLPQYESDLNPTILVRQRGERRVLVVDANATPMRKDPQREPIVPRDLRAERDLLVKVVEAAGARIGRLQAFGSFGDAVVVVRDPLALRAIALLSWVLDPQTDIDGRRRATPLQQREFEEKIAAFGARLQELEARTVIARVAPARLERRRKGQVVPEVAVPGGDLPDADSVADLWVVDTLSDRDGSWDVRKSFELEARLAATDLFARIPGARVKIEDEPAPAQPPREARPTPELEQPAAAPPPVPEPARPTGPPIVARELGARLVLRLPAERFDSEAVAALSRGGLDVLTGVDQVSGPQRDRMHKEGCGFVAPLEFLSEVFIEGKPLDKKRLESEARPGPEGTRLMEVHLPRFGAALLIDGGPGQRWVSSELSADPAALLAVARA
jgi:hypothetical protein